MTPVKLKITGMTCAHCARTVERALKNVPGVEKVRVNYLKKEAEVHGEATPEALAAAVEAAGYGASPRGA
ncbi:CopZ family metallochaperone [Marinithermus hydrothermalis]|uniref:Heavy metal transport/detoxification protein n=1 Tax=Marinithermus hydrothermalis (strain DSM 14884 / JCM 11576 / T1) TaxID=869210 RepID=F2NN03_MARHT|nr:heavy metal-associated domain-containing protein [Marinithermus hydrothermalis]AEB12742.1 Heavy metal transport/detoxification protein [Marinithermus hydrothermalis DSM 14884]